MGVGVHALELQLRHAARGIASPPPLSPAFAPASVRRATNENLLPQMPTQTPRKERSHPPRKSPRGCRECYLLFPRRAETPRNHVGSESGRPRYRNSMHAPIFLCAACFHGGKMRKIFFLVWQSHADSPARQIRHRLRKSFRFPPGTADTRIFPTAM